MTDSLCVFISIILMLFFVKCFVIKLVSIHAQPVQPMPCVSFNLTTVRTTLSNLNLILWHLLNVANELDSIW